ncbi:MAG TPA: hypothetical protein VHQ45_11555 [Gemmatimonadaceae bacterium]|nr:hypothetical protein [Gemmatimonadaceae bacterium]
MRARTAANTYVALSAVVIGFQLALAAGAPWGALTMGGAFPGQLPPPMRAAAVGSAVLMLAFAAVVAARAGLALPRWRQASRRLIWVVVAYALVGVVLHVVTPSARERMLWLPVVLMLAGCALVVARSPARAE